MLARKSGNFGARNASRDREARQFVKTWLSRWRHHSRVVRLSYRPTESTAAHDKNRPGRAVKIGWFLYVLLFARGCASSARTCFAFFIVVWCRFAVRWLCRSIAYVVITRPLGSITDASSFDASTCISEDQRCHEHGHCGDTQKCANDGGSDWSHEQAGDSKQENERPQEDGTLHEKRDVVVGISPIRRELSLHECGGKRDETYDRRLYDLEGPYQSYEARL